ncbi:SCP-like protein [Ancylostoma caninum]|uniref:SCP-like protein n=1 Tax=Ancylostoma caninum TaxID=29170 RepID=A0A368FWF4_ANCCA|nr:SCP-like protein [Ancylostoma caninum]
MRTAIAFIAVALFALSDAASYNCGNPESSDDIRDLFLNFHNDARRRVAKGQEPNKQGKLNPAKNMHKLSWNCEMEKKAQDHIKTCSGGLVNFGSWGANTMSMGGSGLSNPRPIIERILKMWWGKVQQVGLGPDNKYPGGALYTFGNMVNSEATEIGCAYKVCGGNKMQVFCFYNEMGYMTGMTLYETGQACKSGADCKYKGSSCDDGLCVKPKEVPDDGKSAECPADSGLTDRIRNKILDVHNELRSLTARGQAQDAAGGFAPKAAAMKKLKYDCSLEKLASDHAKTCKWGHSSPTTRRGIGENIYATSNPKADKLKEAESASRSWFGELAKFGVGQENVFTMKLANRPGKPVGHYTQVSYFDILNDIIVQAMMVWQKTTAIGCGIVNCPTMTYVVCNYKQAGNMLGDPIYEKGEPCSKCPTGDKCAQTEEKLCLL